MAEPADFAGPPPFAGPLRPVGPRGLLVAAGARGLLVAAGARGLLVASAFPAALAAAIRTHAADAGLQLDEVVPAAETVLVQLARTSDLPALRALLAGLPDAVSEDDTSARLVTVAVNFDGADLAEAAQRTGLTERQLINEIVGTTFTAAFTGFSPGFAYLTGLPTQLQLPRRPEPRTRVPVGSFAIADRYAAIYPSASPGGWNLLGTTASTMFDPHRDEPALVTPGAQVRILESPA